MADVPARCARCGNEMRVSEFVDPASLKCPTCGSQLVLDKSKGERATASKLTVRRDKPPEETGPKTASSENGGESRFPTGKRRSRRKRGGKVRLPEYILSWVAFLILTPTFCFLRWSDFFNKSDLETCIAAGMVAFALFYAVLVVEAFHEEMLDGILCLFVPPYSLYYLFFKSDSFFLRAILVSLAAAFGYDIAILVGENAIAAYDYVSWWINEGALETKSLKPR